MFEMLKIVSWNNKELHTIQWLVEGEMEWVFFGREVVEALEYDVQTTPYTKYMSRHCSEDEIIKVKAKELGEVLNNAELELFKIGRKGEWLITETGVYSLIFGSNMPETIEFKRWVKQTIKSLREKTGLEQWQLWRMTDKLYQKKASEIIADSGNRNAKVDNVIANNNVNEIVSCTIFGFNEPLSKKEMEEYSKEMMECRQEVLNKYAENLVMCDGSHVEAKKLTEKWITYKYNKC